MAERDGPATDEAYQEFWQEIGATFPDLAGAASTRYYADNEQRLLREHLPGLDGLRLMKTDLWDEAKNTRILHWAARQGAMTFGVDISPPIAFQAKYGDGAAPLHAVVSDVTKLPFADASFDAIYSMGTIEHFDNTDVAVAEMFRVLKPGGRAIIGVPNRHDPFLRPLMVALMYRLGIYSYGFERCYSKPALAALLEAAGFQVVAMTGILFIPGWLRILDLACHRWARPLRVVTGAAVWPFAFLDRHIPLLRRHGYLIAAVVVRP